MVSAKPSRPLCLAPHQRDNHGHSKRSCDHNECQQVEHDYISPNSGRKLPAYTARRHMPGMPYRRCQTLLATDMDSLTALAVTVPLGHRASPAAARTASFGDVEVPSASATRIHRRAKTAGAALVLRARKTADVSAGSAVRLAFDVLVMTVQSCEVVTRPRKPFVASPEIDHGIDHYEAENRSSAAPRNGVDTPSCLPPSAMSLRSRNSPNSSSAPRAAGSTVPTAAAQ